MSSAKRAYECTPQPTQPPGEQVSGNYVAAKRRGVVDGVDFGYTGEVRFVVRDAVKKHLESDAIVLLSNLGETRGAAGLQGARPRARRQQGMAVVD